jgi:N-methylhydantoinase A
VIETSMEKAIRVISVEKGYDPRDFTLVAFGGGGPLHACALARALRVPRVLVPALPGALSAVGILLADTMREYSRTVMQAVDADLESTFAQLERTGLNVPHGPQMMDLFHALHQRRYGFSNAQRPLEIVNVRVRLVATAEPFEAPVEPVVAGDGAAAVVGSRAVYFDGKPHATRLYERDLLHAGDTLAGPAIISEYSSATILPPGDVLRVDTFGNLVIEVAA